jgi:hypothetical protein
MSDKPTLAISYGEVTEKNLGQLRALNTAIFPVKYNDKFYSDLLNHVEHSKLGIHTSVTNLLTVVSSLSQ